MFFYKEYVVKSAISCKWYRNAFPMCRLRHCLEMGSRLFFVCFFCYCFFIAIFDDHMISKQLVSGIGFPLCVFLKCPAPRVFIQSVAPEFT